MATCSTCGKAMLTERPHRHAAMTEPRTAACSHSEDCICCTAGHEACCGKRRTVYFTAIKHEAETTALDVERLARAVAYVHGGLADKPSAADRREAAAILAALRDQP